MDAKFVEIDGERYTVEKRIFSQSRGSEYKLSKGDGKIHRVCYAVPANTQVYTNGQHMRGFK